MGGVEGDLVEGVVGMGDAEGEDAIFCGKAFDFFRRISFGDDPAEDGGGTDGCGVDGGEGGLFFVIFGAVPTLDEGFLLAFDDLKLPILISDGNKI